RRRAVAGGPLRRARRGTRARAAPDLRSGRARLRARDAGLRRPRRCLGEAAPAEPDESSDAWTSGLAHRDGASGRGRVRRGRRGPPARARLRDVGRLDRQRPPAPAVVFRADARLARRRLRAAALARLAAPAPAAVLTFCSGGLWRPRYATRIPLREE